MAKREAVPKHQQVYRALEREIRAGRWKAGERLPSEAELVTRFGASRITVGRAVRDLQQAGLVERRAGSGTYAARPRTPAGGLSFGLLIPDLGETEIFEPICQGMMASPLARAHALLWGSMPGGTGPGAGTGSASGQSKEERAWELCRQYVERRVSGVFFAPLELTPAKDEVNRRIADALDEAGIPVVLLDRTVLPYPERGRHDLVGIDNRRAGYLMTEHLLRLGCTRVGFVAVRDAAATVDARESGYLEALYRASLPLDPGLVQRLDPAGAGEVRRYMESQSPDAIVCANDWTAGRLMHSVLGLGYRVPEDVRMVGIDDVDYAKLLPVPLTTLRQPTREIGAVALSAMLERASNRDLPTRDILLQGELVVRRSCGGGAVGAGERIRIDGEARAR